MRIRIAEFYNNLVRMTSCNAEDTEATARIAAEIRVFFIKSTPSLFRAP
jgi:hypothetical protein